MSTKLIQVQSTWLFPIYIPNCGPTNTASSRYLSIYAPQPCPADTAWHHRKHLWIMSIITSCCSSVILLSLGRHSPLRKLSAPTSIPEPFMYAFVRPLPLPSTVTKGFVRYIGCICMGFQIHLPIRLRLARLFNHSIKQSTLSSAWNEFLTHDIFNIIHTAILVAWSFLLYITKLYFFRKLFTNKTNIERNAF